MVDPKDGDGSEPLRARWTQLHLWQIQPVRDVLLGLGLFGLFVLGGKVSIVTVPLLLALLLAYLFEPLVQRLTRVHWLSRPLATGGIVTLTVVVVFVPLFVGTGFGVVQAVRLVGRTVERVGAVRASWQNPSDAELREALGEGGWLTIRDTLVELDRPEGEAEPQQEEAGVASTFLGIDSEDIAEAARFVMDWLTEHGGSLGSRALSTGTGAVSAAVALAGSFGMFLFGTFLTAFFFYFLSTGWERVTEFVRGLLPVRNRERVVEIASRMDLAISGFIRGRLTIALILAVFYSIGFSLMGVPAPLVVGPAIAALALVPYAALAGIPVVIVFLWLENHTGFRGEIWWIIGAPIVWYNVGQLLDDYILTPVIQGKGTDLDTPTILFASLAGAALMGLYGLLVAIPLAACLKILMKEVFWPRFRAWSEGKERDFLPIDEN